MTLYTICRDVAAELGTAIPSTVIANQDSVATRLKALLQTAAEGLLADDHNWNILERMYTFTTTATISEYALPSDFAKPCARTQWNRATRWRMNGPLTPEQWAYLKARPFASTLAQRYRLLRSATGNTLKFTIDPTPTVDGQTIAFQYYSNGWCQSALGVVQQEMLADTDTGILAERLLKLSLKFRYAQALQRASAIYTAEFDRALDVAKAEDIGMNRLRTGIDDRRHLPGVEGVILGVPWEDMTGATWETWGVGS